MVECFDEEGHCVIAPSCKLQHVIGRALRAYIDTMSAYTLEDLLEPRQDLSSLLDIPQKVA